MGGKAKVFPQVITRHLSKSFDDSPPTAASSVSHGTVASKLIIFRATVFVSLVMTSLVCGLLIYFLLDNYEKIQYEDKYSAMASQIGYLAKIGLNRAVESSAMSAVYFGMYHNKKDMWPYIMNPTFSMTFRDVQPVAYIQALGIAPLINASEVDTFNSFTNEACMNLTGSWTNYRVHTTVDPNSSAYSGPDALAAPLVNVEPWESFRLLDLYCPGKFGHMVDKVIACSKFDRKASFGHTERCASLSKILEGVYSAPPSVFILSPIYPLEDPDDLVGLMFTALSMENFLQKTIPEYITGLDCVIHSVQNPLSYEEKASKTYSIDNGGIVLKCSGDCHNSRFSDMKRSVVLDIEHAANSSHSIILNIYPCNEFYDLYRTNLPLYAALFSSMSVVIAALLFVAYDHFVQVEKSAKKHIFDTKRRLVRFASHEIRTPLNTVILGIELLHQLVSMLLERTPDGSTQCARDKKQQQEDLEVLAEVQSSTTAAVMVLDDLLGYDEIEMDLMDMESHPVPAMDFLKSSIKQFNIQAKHSRVELRVKLNKVNENVASVQRTTSKKILTAEGPASISQLCFVGDKHRLLQVIRNLISNALKFTPDGGLIEITATWKPTAACDAKIKYQCASVVFAVRDTGPGISKCNQQLLFGEGVQFDANRLQEGRGSGLGLYISKTIVAAHKGSIWAESEGEGTGSCFYVELPLIDINKMDETSTRRETFLKSHSKYQIVNSHGHAKRRSSGGSSSNDMVHIVVRTKLILVVDDAMSNRKMVRKMLNMNGFSVDLAVDGQECLDIMRACDIDKYDCILLDYVMPNMNGPEVSKSLREMGFKNPIIGLTGNVMTDDVRHFLNNGADIVMPKPFNFQEFKDMLINPCEDVN